MSRATELNSAGDDLRSETLNWLPDFPARVSMTTQSSGPGPASILYADNDAPLRGFGVEILTSSGYAVTPVEDGLQAWAALHLHRFELLITGDSMPQMTGLELAAQTRLEGMKLPIIVVLGAVELQSAAHYDWLRVAARLRKPFATEELLKTVEQVLRPAASVRQRRDISFPLLPQSFSHITPYQHWGLNE